MAADVISAAKTVHHPPVDPVMRRSIGLVRRREDPPSPAAEATLPTLRQQLQVPQADKAASQ